MRIALLFVTLRLLAWLFMPVLLLAGGLPLCREYQIFLSVAYQQACARVRGDASHHVPALAGHRTPL